MIGEKLFNDLAEANDQEAMLETLNDEALRLISQHIITVGAAKGDHSDTCGAVIMECWSRFTEQSDCNSHLCAWGESCKHD